MSNTLFRIPVATLPLPQPIQYHQKILSIGSCFSEHISQIMQQRKFDVCSNPFGISYNPLSIVHQLELLLTKENMVTDDLFFYQEKWQSWQHHGLFAAMEKEAALEKMQTAFLQGKKYLKEAHYIIITWGTAYAYFLKENGQSVNNCHKMSGDIFSHQMLRSEKITERFLSVFEAIKKVNPTVQFVFTVSPVRHTNLSASENTLSKAQLITACHEICAISNGYYFPSYEIMMDELRDYRFYEADMLHPNKVAIQYIWNRFLENCVAAESKEILLSIEKINSGLQHRPFDENLSSYQAFLKNLLAQIEHIEKNHPSLKFLEEKRFLDARIIQ